VGFARFSLVALPFTLFVLPAAWLALSRLARADGPIESRGRDAVSHALATLGPVSRPERKVALVFGAAASLWVLGEAVRPLLAPLAKALGASGLSSKHYEAAVSVLAGLVLVAARGVRWASLRAVPWSALVLLGGSFAMAQAIDASGLGAWMGAELAGIASLPPAAQLVAVSFGAIGLSAVASNTATINVALAVLPRSLPLWTAAMLGASCDFMLPAGTPPNAIVFGTGAVRLRTMVRAGLVLDVVAALLVAAYVHVYARHVLPSWSP
jgi:sodium-dependent dicarboxylate transporter 2/3/5